MYYERKHDCIDCKDCVDEPHNISCNVACGNTKKNCYETHKVFAPKIYARANIYVQLDCHYVEQNYKALRRFIILKKTLQQLGIETGRIKLLWASAAEGAIFTDEVNKFIEQVRALGPLEWPTSGDGMERMFAEPAHMLVEEVAA